ncbi:MAG: VOC family protein [Cyanobacteria bacterium J06638_20]
MKLNKLIPMLNVSNLEASLEFYKTALNFELVSSENDLKEWRWGTIRSGETELMLSETDTDLGLKKGIAPCHDTSWPTIFYFYPDDVEALYQHVTRCGYNVTPLETTFYGMKEFSLQDPDGHMLTLGQDAG